MVSTPNISALTLLRAEIYNAFLFNRRQMQYKGK